MKEMDSFKSGHNFRRTVAVLKGTAEYARWVERLSREARIPTANLLDIALCEWAEQHGHPAPPTRLSGPGRAEAQERTGRADACPRD
jgi:hypothetical protein